MAKRSRSGQKNEEADSPLEIIWRQRAIDDVERLHVFLSEKKFEVASRAIGAINSEANFLSYSPFVGRPLLDRKGRREWIVPFGSGAYVLRYMIDDQKAIVIIRVWHSRENRN